MIYVFCICRAAKNGGMQKLTKLKLFCQKYKEPILYIVFGVLTTVVNYIIYFTCTAGAKIGWSAATVLAWTGAVLFAYVTNRKWVFVSRAKGVRAISAELAGFVAARLLSLGMEWLCLKLLLDVLHMNSFLYRELPAGEFLAKTIAQIIVIISNYVFSKWFVFRKKEEKNE